MTFRHNGRPLVYGQLNQASELLVADSSGTTLQDLMEHNAVVLINGCGVDCMPGEVVILDAAADNTFNTTTTPNYTGSVGILQEATANGATGLVAFGGHVSVVNLGGAAPTRGHYLVTSSTAGQATTNIARTTGTFGQVTTDDANSAALLLGMVDQVGARATDHGALIGLSDDDHPQYVEKADAIPINVVIDGGGATITTGVKVDLVMDFAATIQGVTMLADQSGSIVVDIWRDTYANYPPTVADTITASAKPTISSATKSQDTTLTGWTTAISAGDILRFNVDSATTIQRVTLGLKVRRT